VCKYNLNRTGFAGGWLDWALCGHWLGLKVGVVGHFGFSRQHVADGLYGKTFKGSAEVQD
jgi:hypothetical protein